MGIREKMVFLALVVMVLIYLILTHFTSSGRDTSPLPGQEKFTSDVKTIPQSGDSFFPKMDDSMEEKSIIEETFTENN